MKSRTRIAQLHKELDEAKAMETAAMGEFRRDGTPYYEKEWSRAIEKSRELGESYHEQRSNEMPQLDRLSRFTPPYTTIEESAPL